MIGRLRQAIAPGLINAVVSVPDGLASAALAGVNPIFGLYTSIAAAIGGSLLVSAQLMQVATTSASALAAGQTVAAFAEGERARVMFLLTVLVGLWLTLFGMLRLGRLARFVSHAVMTGFLAGVAVVLVLDQLAPLVGYAAQGRNEIVQAIDLLTHASQFNVPTIVTGVLALGLALGLGRTRLGNIASIVALVLPALLVAVLGWDSVQRVADVSPIPRGVPLPALPDLSLLSLELVGAAFAIAIVIAVQGVGVSQSVENPDARPVDPSRDMLAQGAANVLSGMVRGIPAGGSVGQTALNVSAGARSRWAGVMSGVWLIVFVALVPNLVGYVPMAVLAALMIVAGLSAIDVKEARSIWRTSGAARWSILVTFVATLVLSVPVAVGVGVALSIMLYVASSASDVTVGALVPLADGRFADSEPPARLPSHAVTVLYVEGSLFFAGARTLEESLPDPAGAERPAVVLRLRGRTRIGSTLIDVLDDYADDLAKVGGRLYLSGVHPALIEQLERAGKLEANRDVHLVEEEPVRGTSTVRAIADARAWLGAAHDDVRSDAGRS